MEKLQPLIKHHYWICFGLAVIFALTGWALASGDLSEQIKTRRDSVDDSFRKADESQANGVPNQQWIEGAKEFNAQDQKAYDKSSRGLWERQQQARVWHKQLADEMSRIPFQSTIESSITRAKWGAHYKTQFESILDIVDPFDFKTGEGLVIVDNNRVAHERFDRWRTKPPLSDEVWRNQEDLWLTKEILEAVAATNRNATRISESGIPEIIRLSFRGGDRNAEPPAAGGGAGGGSFGGGMSGGGSSGFGGGGDDEGYEGGSGMGNLGSSGGAMAGAGPWKGFAGAFGSDLLSEEFGGGRSSAGGFGGSGSSSGSGSSGIMGSGGMGSFGASGGAGAAASAADRYVDDEEGAGYKTRAFLLHVKVREGELPTLLASLTNSDFPVEIVRVDVKMSAGGGGMSSGGGMGYGSGGMGNLTGMGGMGSGMGSGMGDLGSLGGMMGGGSGLGYGGEDEDDGEMGGGYGGYPGGSGGYPGGSGGYPGGSGGYPGGEGDSGYPGGGMGYGGGGMGSATQTAQEMLSAAMNDPYLREVRIAGLMTLYQTQEESVAEEATEASAADEAAADAASGAEGVGDLPDEEGTDTSAESDGDTSAAESGDADASNQNTATEGEPAGGDDNVTTPASGGDGDETKAADNSASSEGSSAAEPPAGEEDTQSGSQPPDAGSGETGN